MRLNSLLILHGILVLLGALIISILISITIFYVPDVIIRLINNIKNKKDKQS